MRVEFKLSWALKPTMNNQGMRHHDKKPDSEVAPYRKLELYYCQWYEKKCHRFHTPAETKILDDLY